MKKETEKKSHCSYKLHPAVKEQDLLLAKSHKSEFMLLLSSFGGEL